jgi:hypothetical protein
MPLPKQGRGNLPPLCKNCRRGQDAQGRFSKAPFERACREGSGRFVQIRHFPDQIDETGRGQGKGDEGESEEFDHGQLLRCLWEDSSPGGGRGPVTHFTGSGIFLTLLASTHGRGGGAPGQAGSAGTKGSGRRNLRQVEAILNIVRLQSGSAT